MKQLTQVEIKKTLGTEAAQIVKEGMNIGLGTGSTAACFIESLIERRRSGINFSAVSSSTKSMEQAQAGGIPTLSIDSFTTLDLTVDGADEIDLHGRMIKGGGGALVREKILATSSRRLVILVDESKLVEHLGRFGLPLEIIPFGFCATVEKIQKLGYLGKLRLKNDGSPYITDNGNWIYDLSYPKIFTVPEEDHEKLIQIPGVVETGFFLNLPLEVLIGYHDGTMKKVVYG